MREHSPAGMLARLNDVVLRRREGCRSRFCTLALVELRERPDGALDACVALGGHAQPLVRRADGSVDRVGAHGTLIGAVPRGDPARRRASRSLPATCCCCSPTA